MVRCCTARLHRVTRFSLQEVPFHTAEVSHHSRRRTNVQQLTCKINLHFSFYYLFFSFVLLELKPFVLKGLVLGKNYEKVPKSAKNYETILPFSCCPLVFPWTTAVRMAYRATTVSLALPNISTSNQVYSRGRELNTNIFFSNFSGAPGISRQNPGISRQKVWYPWVSKESEGHTELFGPHPFTWKTPTPAEDIRTKKFGFGFLFLAWYSGL